jgi:hypothetical protein
MNESSHAYTPMSRADLAVVGFLAHYPRSAAKLLFHTAYA